MASRFDRGMICAGYSEVCAGCGVSRALYRDLVTGCFYVDCPVCGFSEYCTEADKTANVCRYCGMGVYYSEEEEFERAGEPDDEAVVCVICGAYCHRACAEAHYHKCVDLEQEFICPDCPDDTFVECCSCGLLHEGNCMVPMGSEGSQVFGDICNDCFYDDEHDIEQALEYVGLDRMLSKEKARYYFRHAAENPDLTICCTHLINASDDEQAFETLCSILHDQTIKASITGYYGRIHGTEAVCLTELTIRGLLEHAKTYSPFGLGFLKGWIFAQGGGPALYIRDDLIGRQDAQGVVETRLRPSVNKINLDTYDSHHEREWRVPMDLHFGLEDVVVVYAPIRYHKRLRERYPNLGLLLDIYILALL